MDTRICIFALAITACGGGALAPSESRGVPRSDNAGNAGNAGTSSGTGGTGGVGGGGVGGVGGGGGGAVQQSLIVTANGQRIGRLQNAGEWSLLVWDDETDLLFHISDITGFVSGIGVQQYVRYYESSDCSGIARDSGFGLSTCESLEGESPPRRIVIRDSLDWAGLTEAASLYVKVGGAVTYSPRSYSNQETCIDTSESWSEVTYCGFKYEITTMLPTSFPLPIEIVGE